MTRTSITVYYKCGHIGLRQLLPEEYQRLTLLSPKIGVTQEMKSPKLCQLCKDLTTAQALTEHEKYYGGNPHE